MRLMMNDSDHHPDVQVHPDMSSTSPAFQADGSAPFAQQPQYQYGSPHHSSQPFTIDTDMSNIDSFTDSVQGGAHAGGSLGGPGVGDGASHTIATSVSGATDLPAGLSIGAPGTPGMAPPQMGSGQGHREGFGPGSAQGQQTPYSPTGPHASIDENADMGFSGGDPKRKRSKVSRACDECRRKKVRCDAAGDDGTIKTCTNCAKAGVLCGYNRIPMKRGPSKGYIKELSERVQQVESQMAMSNTPGTFRQSLDAGTVGALYADQSLYSPEDAMSFKRNFSFSDQQRSPFANPEFNRDRMPSVSWNAVSPHASGFRGSFGAGDKPRHRGSVAIAPDQQPPLPIVTPLAKPFWMSTDSDSDNPRASKRQKMDTFDDEQIAPPVIAQEFLGKYYAGFHGNLPLLPDVDVSIEIVQKARPKVQHAFVAATNFLPLAKVKTQARTGEDTSDTSTTISSIFKVRQALEDYVWDTARDSPESRNREDNLVLLWTYLLMAVGAENDLSRLRDGRLSKALIIKLAVDLGWNCIVLENKQKQATGSETAEVTQHKMYLARAWYCTGILARIHALAVGSSNPIPLQQDTPLPNPPAVFPPSQVFRPLTSNALSTVINLVQNTIPPAVYGRHIDTMFRSNTRSHLENVFTISHLDVDGERHAQRIRLFYDLLLARFTLLGAPCEICIPAMELATALKEHMTASDEKHVYNPLDLHMFTLTTITLLEFCQDGVDIELSSDAADAVGVIQSALEQISERNHLEEEQQQEQQQPKEDTQQQAMETAAGQNGEKETTTTTTATTMTTQQQQDAATSSGGIDIDIDIETETAAADEVFPGKPIHWADVLLGMIEARRQTSDVLGAGQNGNGNNNGNGHPPAGSEKNEFTVAVDFSRLLRYGYLNVLAEYAGM